MKSQWGPDCLERPLQKYPSFAKIGRLDTSKRKKKITGFASEYAPEADSQAPAEHLGPGWWVGGSRDSGPSHL